MPTWRGVVEWRAGLPFFDKWGPDFDLSPQVEEFDEVNELRMRCARQFDEDLERFDQSVASIAPGLSYGHPRRSDFEAEKRTGAYSDIRVKLEAAARAVRSRAGGPEPLPEPTIILTVPVHIITQDRLQKLKHTLKSIGRMDVPPGRSRLIVALSWYADDDFRDDVRQALDQLESDVVDRSQTSVDATLQALPAPHYIVECGRRLDWPAARPSMGSTVHQVARPRPRRQSLARRGQSPQARTQTAAARDSAAARPGPAASGQGATSEEASASADPTTVDLKYTLRVSAMSCQAIFRHQSTRKAQFEHFQSAIIAAEIVLWREFQTALDGRDGRSVWVMFGDDDDLWHPRRVPAFVAAMRAHQLLECVGVFATLARANVEAKELNMLEVDQPLPTNCREVDEFLDKGLATLNQEEENSSAWLEALDAAGEARSKLLLPDGLNLEYFDFCPRLRIVKDFFRKTSPDLLAHRFCDLHFCEFLTRYNLRGRECGLELSFVESKTWLYFYANRQCTEEEYYCACEGDGEDVDLFNPRPVGCSDSNVSNIVFVTHSEAQHASNSLDDFKSLDPTITPSKLSRYVAHCRHNMELMLIRDHQNTIDQCDLGQVIRNACSASFMGYIENYSAGFSHRGAEELMLLVGQKIATSVARKLKVDILWRDSTQFIDTAPDDSASNERSTSVSEDEDQDIKNALARVSDTALAEWQATEAVQGIMQTFTLQAAWGEATAFEAVGARNILAHFGSIDLEIVAAQTAERRIAPDGEPYTFGEFIDWFGAEVGTNMWGEADTYAGEGGEETLGDHMQMRRRAIETLLEIFDAKGTGVITFQQVCRAFEVFEMTARDFWETWVEKQGGVPYESLCANYEVIHRLGHGQKNSVYVCKHVETGDRAALKCPVTETEQGIMATLEKAYRDSAFAPCPRILESGTYLDERYAVMELCGSNLGQVADRLWTFADFDDPEEETEHRWRMVSVVGRILLRRLMAVHDVGVVHCNVAPKTVVLARRPTVPGISCYLVNFGCAQMFHAEPVDSDYGNIEFAPLRSAETCVRYPLDDIEALGWLLLHLMWEGLPWADWMEEFSELKPALKRVKQEDLLTRIRDAKVNLVQEGVFVDPGAGHPRHGAQCPPHLLDYLRRCQPVDHPKRRHIWRRPSRRTAGRTRLSPWLRHWRSYAARRPPRHTLTCRPAYESFARCLGGGDSWSTRDGEELDGHELESLLGTFLVWQ